jgi:membrane protein implicated in regulation of membrane protease activity
MTGARLRVSIIALILFAAYSVFVVVTAISAGKGEGPVFWTSIVVIIVLAAAALWLARRMLRRRPKPG